MPMPTTNYSRLNVRYLASRYAGATFMLLALGLLAGLAYRLLMQPTVYSSQSEVAVSVTPREAGTGFDWDAKANEWRQRLHDRSDWGLLSVNLRYALKLAITEKDGPPNADLPLTLAEFNDGVEYSESLFRNRYLHRFGKPVTITKTDLAQYLDFQSLAMIVSDMGPPSGRTDWDFSFFRKELPSAIGAGSIADPDPNNIFFRVFYKLHELVNGRPALTPHAAWRSAVQELSSRINRESELSGGGGFGIVARRELLREIEAIPVLVANRLYHANGWLSGEGRLEGPATIWAQRWSRDVFVNLLFTGHGNAIASTGISMELNPLFAPRDTPVTRISPLATSTLLNFIAAREDAATTAAIPATVAVESDIVSDPVPEALYVAELEELPPTPDTIPEERTETTELSVEPYEDPNVASESADSTYVEMYDEVAAKQRESLIRMHEEAVKLANVERDSVLRQLYTVRATSNRLSHEAITARNRADRLRERYDQMAAASEVNSQPKVPQQTAELFQRRDEILQRLITLREYCTEEHPFVKLALRDLRALEQMLGDHVPDAAANRDAEARATRLANLYLEWETATAQADAFEERARQHDDDIACLLDEVTNLERCISQREIELDQARNQPVPIIRVAVTPQPIMLPPAPEPLPAVTVAKEIPEPAPPTSTVEAVEIFPRLAFAQFPSSIATTVKKPDWRALWWGLLGGFLLSLLWMLLRELFADRFCNVGEAHRLVGLPVLASLPAYSQASVQSAAETMKGEILRTRPGRFQFMPMPVELVEPPPEGKRGKIKPARKRIHFLAWIFGILFLVLAGLLYYRSLTGPIVPSKHEAHTLALPSVTAPAWARENAALEDAAWGGMP